MKVSYFPGCSGHGTGIELDQSTRELCDLLDIDLVELNDWNCCGASSAHVVDHELSLSLAARNLAIADQTGDDVLTPCSACFNRLAGARKHILEEGKLDKVPNATGKSEVKHIFDLFSIPEVLERMQKVAPNGLKGLKVVCYYGCLTSRPKDVTGVRNAENPMEMDNILKSLGAEVFDWSMKTQCCGGSLTLSKDEIVEKLSSDLFAMAARVGAEAIVTGCPMCFMNLERQWTGDGAQERTKDIPIFYFTELMLLALDPKLASQHLKRHLSDPKPLLQGRELA